MLVPDMRRLTMITLFVNGLFVEIWMFGILLQLIKLLTFLRNGGSHQRASNFFYTQASRQIMWGSISQPMIPPKMEWLTQDISKQIKFISMRGLSINRQYWWTFLLCIIPVL